MKVVFITPVTPYKENMGGPSGHPYHLMVERPKDMDITVYSYNQNGLSAETIAEVEKELNVKIQLLAKPKWMTCLFKLHLSFLRLFMKYPINYYHRLSTQTIEEINNIHPDLVWVYSQEYSGILKQLKEYNRLHTVPDCYSLHFYRRLALRSTMASKMEYWKILTNYRKHYRMEQEYDSSNNIVYHLVGEADRGFLLNINPSLNAHFIRHPRYEIAEPQKTITFGQPKIKLLIAGRNDFYMKEKADEMVDALAKAQQFTLRENYILTFLGKGWEGHIKTLKDAGYEVEHITFAPDYVEEVRKHDIQITPIAIGTGTKGKVLDAIVNGLLVIGTNYALENIAVKDGLSCLEYNTQKELLAILSDIPLNREHYEQMAEQGRQAALKEHNREKVSAELFGLI
ncbi:MAG: glycosyltransferase family 1 protein [Prevotella sp.]|nr:glycosyltransferase family 1 protein [Prevotella sp.]